MTSQALISWQTRRAGRLDRLEAAHAAFSGHGPGRRWKTEELNHAIFLRLAAEFQGCCRDMHTECIEALVAGMHLGGSLETIVTAEFGARRRLDAGSASPGTIGADFARLGLTLWPDLGRRYPRRSRLWNANLTFLHTARDGIVHDDQLKLAEVQASWATLTLPSARYLRRSLDGLAKGMDTVCGEHLRNVLGTLPW